jgi:hypothetical protein
MFRKEFRKFENILALNALGVIDLCIFFERPE